MSAVAVEAAGPHLRRSKRIQARSNSKKLSVISIPLDLISEIVVRLPVKAFARFRCVSKSFLSLLTDQRLIHKLAIQANEKAEDQRLLCAFGDYRPLYTIKLGTTVTRSRIPSNVLKELPWWITESVEGHTELLGSCNGLVCVSVENWIFHNFWLFNPLTRESYEVPFTRKIMNIRTRFHGFGFDSSTGDYKIVHGRMSVNRRGFDMEVFSLKNNSWKSRVQESSSLCKVPYKGLYGGQVAILHGALHWDVDKISTSIVSYDLSQEELREILLPPSVELGVISLAGHVGVLQGRLSVTYTCTQTGMISVWIMEEYDVTQSWMKSLSIKLERPYDRWSPICCTAKGEIILRNLFAKRKLHVYDPKSKTLSICQLPKGLPKATWFWMATYVETLVSIQALRGEGNQGSGMNYEAFRLQLQVLD